MLRNALKNPSTVAWHGPSHAVASLQSSTSLEVTSVAVGASDGTERRVDAALLSADGREWSVPFFVAEGSSGLTKLWVYERPDPFEPTSGLVVVVNGASGVGKSALLEAVHDVANTPWIVFDEPHVGRVPTEHMIWRAAAPSLHRAGFVAMRSLAESGVQVATAAGGFDHATICDSLAGVPILRVALRCSEAVR